MASDSLGDKRQSLETFENHTQTLCSELEILKNSEENLFRRKARGSVEGGE
ncbi:hypothetical protein RyT2_25540 [Pseudolactococcus yaeyamensis]